MSTMVIRNTEDAGAFRRDGYIVIPFLDQAQVDELRQFYFQHHEEDDVRRQTIPSYAPGFYTSTFNNDLAYRQAMNAAVTRVCAPALERVFVEYRVFFAGFLVKLPDANGRLRVHQDPTLVDEARFMPVNVWCPLQDIDERNGALRVLPGSHLLFSGPRATSIPAPWQSYERLIERRMASIHMPAGSAVLFTQATLHASEPNRSDQPRITATLFVCYRSASIQIAHRNPATPHTIDLYAQDDDFMFRNSQFSTDSTGTPKIGRHIGSMPYDDTPIEAEAIGRLGTD
jgi:hypothetical protein